MAAALALPAVVDVDVLPAVVDEARVDHRLGGRTEVGLGDLRPQPPQVLQPNSGVRQISSPTTIRSSRSARPRAFSARSVTR